MKKSFLFALAGLLTLVFTACENQGPTIPESFPKKHLIEEFTGQTCGWCPGGMEAIHTFVGNDTNWIVILHHYGYQQDNFTVKGSKTITNKLGVNGAPSVAVDRLKTNYGSGKAIVFSPYDFPDVNRSQFETTTYASMHITNTFDESDKTLTVRVTGEIAKVDYPNLKLTVLVKESGMIDYQSDYQNTYEGWQEFRHTDAVRAFLSDPLGDSVRVQKDRRYAENFEIAWDDKWVPENCMVVAFLSEDFKPVVQAEQRPVLEGTKGGADLLPGGITPVPVSDWYPEPDATSGPADFSGQSVDTLSSAGAWYTNYASYGFTYWQIQAYGSQVITVGNTKCVPFAMLYLFTEAGTTAIPTGTYELNTSMQPGTAYAGFRDDSQMAMDGSMYYYTSQSYFNQGYLVPSAQWLIVSGTLVISEEGWTLEGKARNGADIRLVGTTPIRSNGPANAQQKKMRQSAPETTVFGKKSLQLLQM